MRYALGGHTYISWVSWDTALQAPSARRRRRTLRVIGIRVRVQSITHHIILWMWALGRFQMFLIASLKDTVFIYRRESKIQSYMNNITVRC